MGDTGPIPGLDAALCMYDSATVDSAGASFRLRQPSKPSGSVPVMELSDSYLRVFPQKIVAKYDWLETRKAAAVFANTNPAEFSELTKVLDAFDLLRQDILAAGKNEGPIAKKLNKAFRDRGWREGQWDGHMSSELRLMPYKDAGEKAPRVFTSSVFSSGYKVDNVKVGVAIDVEWNAKDGNLDRDLAAYRALYEAGVISVGVIITRAHQDTRDLCIRLGHPDGLKTSTTTNLEKLEPRLTRGDSGGCPLLAVAITSRCLSPPESA
jgi:hypothetical protein